MLRRSFFARRRPVGGYGYGRRSVGYSYAATLIVVSLGVLLLLYFFGYLNL